MKIALSIMLPKDNNFSDLPSLSSYAIDSSNQY